MYARHADAKELDREAASAAREAEATPTSHRTRTTTADAARRGETTGHTRGERTTHYQYDKM